MQIWDHPVSQPSPHSVFQPLPCPPQSSRPLLAMSPLHPGCPSPPLLSIWMNVSSLSPWLSNFHTVQFSGSSGCFLFLNLLSFFWLCEEAKCIYLCLHLGWKSCSFPIFVSRGKGAFFSKICPLFNQAFWSHSSYILSLLTWMFTLAFYFYLFCSISVCWSFSVSHPSCSKGRKHVTPSILEQLLEAVTLRVSILRNPKAR